MSFHYRSKYCPSGHKIGERKLKWSRLGLRNNDASVMSLGMSGVQPCLPCEFLLCGPKEMMPAVDSCSLPYLLCEYTPSRSSQRALTPGWEAQLSCWVDSRRKCKLFLMAWRQIEVEGKYSVWVSWPRSVFQTTVCLGKRVAQIPVSLKIPK